MSEIVSGFHPGFSHFADFRVAGRSARPSNFDFLVLVRRRARSLRDFASYLRFADRSLISEHR